MASGNSANLSHCAVEQCIYDRWVGSGHSGQVIDAWRQLSVSIYPV
jgi:hypothetical protein